MRNLLAVVILIIALSGCNQDKVVFDEVSLIPQSQWAYGDTYDFSFEVQDTSEIYRLLLYVEFATDYAWQNLYTSIKTTYPGDSTRTDVVSFELATKTGEWYGDCNAKRCKLNIPLQESVRFPKPGEYSISFEQYMREEVVEGVTAVGLKLVIPAEQ